jgi:hypothetical protein
MIISYTISNGLVKIYESIWSTRTGIDIDKAQVAYHLRCPGRASGYELPSQFDSACLRIHSQSTDEVIDRELNSFLRCHALLP